MTTILIIDSDLSIRQQITGLLEKTQYHVVYASTLPQAFEIAQRTTQLITLLNARLSWAESFSLLRLLEARNAPVLFLTADPGSMRHLRALYHGPCSVLLSPFDDQQLLHSITTLLADCANALSIGALRLDITNRKCTLDGEALSLTAQEFSLLQALMESPDAPLTREELLRTAWGYHTAGETRTVDVHIQRLRRKLGASCIETVYKLGYRLKMA